MESLSAVVAFGHYGEVGSLCLFKMDRIPSFDVSRLGVIGRSMFISFFFDQTGGRRGQRLG